jgi:hypothetical protein
MRAASPAADQEETEASRATLATVLDELSRRSAA